MTAASQRTFGHVLDHTYISPSVGWIIDQVLPDYGLTGVHGAPRSGRTSFIKQAVAAVRSGTGLLGRQTVRTLGKVTIFSTNPWAADQYYSGFSEDPGVQVVILTVPSVTDPGPWEFARRTASGFDSELVVLDTMPQCLPEQVATAKAEIDLFGVPVLAVFAGAASTQTIRPDDWRSEFTAGIHLLGKQGTTTALNLYSQVSSPTEVPVAWIEQAKEFWQTDSAGRPVPPVSRAVDASQVCDLATIARLNKISVGAPSLVASKLLSDCYGSVAQVCGWSPSQADLAAAIATHDAAWRAGLNPPAQRVVLDDEPPF